VPVRALITGCAGFIGSHLSESLLVDGHDVLGVDCFNDNYGRVQKRRNLERSREWDAFEFVPVDLARGELHDLFAECDVVFHLAAEPGVRQSWGTRFETYVRNNVLATQRVLEACRRTHLRRLVYASSSSVYGQGESLPTSEGMAPMPISPYGVTKLGGEHLVSMYARSYGLDAVTLRYFSVYGPRQRPDMAFSRFMDAALSGRPIELFGGRQTRDFTFVSDIVRATRAAADAGHDLTRVLNVGGGSRVSLDDCIALISELAGQHLEVLRSEVQRGDVLHTGADISAARAQIGFEPAVDLVAGLEAQWEWTQANRARVH
jgi:nucleoside-diphosphate-sugar epimerase